MPEVNADAIPAELKERDQWLLWDESNDTPRQPHWKGDFAVSWSDPADWHSFPEAIDAARDVESWGVGYVMASENGDHARGLYSCIDIDGGVKSATEDGVELADWVPSIDQWLDDGAYVELSPSGTGLHIPFVGQEVPEWWSDSQLNPEDDDHEGVDVLQNKFCTFTGKVVAGSGDSVSDRAPAEWLFSAYKSLNGETPRIASSTTEESRSAPDEDLTKEQVEDALSHLNPGCDYEKWRDLAFAVHDWDSGSRGRTVFESWSRQSSKWDSDAEDIVDWVWANANEGSSSSGVTVATLVYHAKQEGWSFSSSKTNESGNGDDEELSTRELIAKHSEEYDDASEVPANVLSKTKGGVKMSSSSGDQSGEEDGQDESDAEPRGEFSWSDVRTTYNMVEAEDDVPKGRARQAAADVLESETSWMFVLESERLWVYDDESGVYNKFGRARAANTLVEQLEEHYSQSEKREIVGILEDRNQVRREELNASGQDEPLLCVGNGVVNLATAELLDHSPKYKFVRGLSWQYDPDNADTEAVIDFLDDVTERKADRDTLLDHLAHGLMPGHPYRAFVVCYGPGGNGKTQVAELFRGFVGEHNAASVEIDELANDDFATSDLTGAYLNWGDDMAGDGGGALQDLSMLKKATGGSKIRANEKHTKTWDFTNEAALFFSANEPPRIGEQKKSIQDRIYPIEMPYEFVADPDEDNPLEKQKVPGISEEMLEDDAAMRGLLMLAVEHAQRLVNSNGEYSQPESPEQRLQKYNESADPIVRFAGKALEPADSGMKIRKDDAYRVYQSFTESWSERSSSLRGFKRQLPKGFPADLENARSRALATPDDEKDRVRCWKRVQWTDVARAEMPDWMVERYPDHFDTDNDESDEGAEESRTDTSGSVGLSSLEEAYSGPGTAEIEVTVTSQMEPKPWLQSEGSVSDGSRTMDYLARGDVDPVPDDAEGSTYRIRNFRLTTDEFDVTVLEFREDTEFVVVDNNQTGDTQSSISDAATDGGTKADERSAEGWEPDEDAEGVTATARRVVATLVASDADAMSRDHLCKTTSGRYPSHGYSASELENAIDVAISEEGWLVEDENGVRQP